jgi:hypothetical protein
MLGFKRFRSAAVTLSGIELMHRIRKGQFDLTSMHLKDTTSPSIWMAVLSARCGIRDIGDFSAAYRDCTTTLVCRPASARDVVRVGQSSRASSTIALELNCTMASAPGLQSPALSRYRKMRDFGLTPAVSIYNCARHAKWSYKGKTRIVQILPAEDGMVFQQLLFADEVRALSDLHIEKVAVSDTEPKLALQIIDRV